MRFFVTGATGFIGLWLVRHLVESGHDVSILARQDQAPEDLRQFGIRVFKGDVLDRECLDRAFQKQDGIFHLAGYVGYKRWERQIMQQVNVEGTRNVINACLKNNVGRLVHMSSVNAIGASPNGEILNENSRYSLDAYSLGYSETKKEAEELVKAANENLDCVILNPSTVYGPGDGRKSSRSLQIKVAKGKFPFYPSGGVSVADVHEVVRATLTAFHKGRRSERYILAGENLKVKEVFELIALEAGVPPPRINMPNWVLSSVGKVGDLLEHMGAKGPINSESAILAQMYNWFDSKKAQQELNYKIISAKTCIHNSIQWMKEQGILDATS